MIIGIDPGINGAMACFYPSGNLELLDVPKIGTNPDYRAWADSWGMHLPWCGHVWIEKVGAMPGQGVTSMFSFGERYGFILGLVAAAGRPYSFVRPAQWKKGVGIVTGAEKGASRIRAKEVFPDAAHRFDRAKDDGRAEAALIAYYGSINGA